jgi:hypothetical protein
VALATFWENNVMGAVMKKASHFGQLKSLRGFVPFMIAAGIRRRWSIVVNVKVYLVIRFWSCEIPA